MWHNNGLHIAQLGQKDEMKEQGMWHTTWYNCTHSTVLLLYISVEQNDESRFKADLSTLVYCVDKHI